MPQSHARKVTAGAPGRAVPILVAEDEQQLAASVARRLGEEGYAVDVASDGEEALSLGLAKRYKLVVLDLLLPKRDGLQVLRELRRNKFTGMVLVVSAKSAVEERVEGLKAGADDYLPKPFAFAELLARVETLLRRQGMGRGPLLKAGDLALDTVTRTVSRAHKRLHLTEKEFLLLELLMRNKNRILTRRVIAEQVWGYTFDTGTNVVDVYINYLRKAIDKGFTKKRIHTVRGVGFILK